MIARYRGVPVKVVLYKPGIKGKETLAFISLMNQYVEIYVASFIAVDAREVTVEAEPKDASICSTS